MNYRIARRVAAIAESATLAVDAKAKALKAAGRPVIGFGAGEPDFATPDYIVKAAIDAAQQPRYHRYSPVAGLPELRTGIATKTARDSGYAVTADQVLVTNGGKQAVYNAFTTLVDPGDEVLLIAPYWTTYPEAIQLAGGVAVIIETDETTGYLASIEQLDRALTTRTKILVFVSPSNPTGAVYPPDQVEAIGRWAEEHNLFVITDEIYEHLVYGDARAPSVATLVPELGDRVVVLNGVAKTYAMTGWRVGGDDRCARHDQHATNLQSHSTSNVSNVAQVAALSAVSGNLDVVRDMRSAFDRRRKLIVNLLDAIPGVVCPMPDGAFYVYPQVKALLGRTLGGRTAHTSADLAALILEQVEVAAVPGEAFGTPGYLRFSYALNDADITTGIERIANLVKASH